MKRSRGPLRRLSHLASKSAFVGAQAAEQIGLVGELCGIVHLEHLADRSCEVRMRVVEALGRLTEGQHSAFAAALQDADELMRVPCSGGDRSSARSGDSIGS
jgi:hypothetical protein